MAERKVKAAFPVRCDGAYSGHPLPTPVDASVTVYVDGKRDVGCSKMGVADQDGICQALRARAYNLACKHKYPK